MPSNRMRTAAATLPLLLFACSAPDQPSPDIALADGWTRQVAPGQGMAAVYLTIGNRGKGEDRLVGADTPMADSATLHQSSSAGGIARMRALEGGLAIPANSRVELSPGGTHVMLGGLKQPLTSGQTIDLNLRFARSGTRSIAIRVVPAAATSPGDHAMHQ